MKRVMMFLAVIALSMVACTLGEAPTPIPTQVPAPLFTSPFIGLNPTSGTVGSAINVAVVGFPAGATVNLYLSQRDNPILNMVAAGLIMNDKGTLAHTFTIPDKLNGNAITTSAPINVTVSTTDNLFTANALFMVMATAGNATLTATPSSGDDVFFITAPPISATISGSSVVVRGSGKAINNRVNVQIVDANYKPLGSAVAIIQAAVGEVGTWQATLTFTQPANSAAAFIIASTSNANGGVAQQASIPVTLSGSGGGVTATSATVAPTTQATATTPTVITAEVPKTPTNTLIATVPFITATPR